MDIIKILEAEQIRGKLTSYPEEIYELRRKKQEIENQIAETKDNLDIISISIENKVYSLFQGKRSNQEQRKSKFVELARKDKDYSEVEKGKKAWSKSKSRGYTMNSKPPENRRKSW